MKKLFSIGLVVIFVLSLTVGLAMAGNGAPSGPHYNLNLIGKKNTDAISGDDSNGRSIMIPLKNVQSREGMVCDVDGTVVVDDIAPTWLDVEPEGAKIYFVAGDTFEVLDRDATDNDGGTVQVPVNLETDEILFDIYIRVLGKPNGCMNIDAYAYDDLQNLWFWSGSVHMNRTKGKKVFVKANELFDVWWCEVDTTVDPPVCIDGTEAEISVFSDVFDNYFWNILNDGTRLVQVRIYPREIQ